MCFHFCLLAQSALLHVRDDGHAPFNTVPGAAHAPGGGKGGERERGRKKEGEKKEGTRREAGEEEKESCPLET